MYDLKRQRRKKSEKGSVARLGKGKNMPGFIIGIKCLSRET